MKYIQSISILSLAIGMVISSFHVTNLNANAEDMNVREVEALLSERMDGMSSVQVHGLTTHLFKLCRKYGFSVSSVLSLISTESSFDKDATSSVGAVGLMQIMPKTAGFIAKKEGIRTYHRAQDLHNPTVNLSVGIAYLSYLRGKYTKSHSYLAAYNMGPTKFNRITRKHKPSPASVKRYVKNIHSGVYEIRREAQELAYAN
jgi:soluble lytic murein transglycosylase